MQFQIKKAMIYVHVAEPHIKDCSWRSLHAGGAYSIRMSYIPR